MVALPSEEDTKMKITKKQLKQIIKEEIIQINEDEDSSGPSRWAKQDVEAMINKIATMYINSTGTYDVSGVEEYLRPLADKVSEAIVRFQAVPDREEFDSDDWQV